jgi:hypothetical protein
LPIDPVALMPSSGAALTSTPSSTSPAEVIVPRTTIERSGPPKTTSVVRPASTTTFFVIWLSVVVTCAG